MIIFLTSRKSGHLIAQDKRSKEKQGEKKLSHSRYTTI